MCSARSTGLLAPVKLPTESASFHEVLLGVYICVDQAVPLKLAAHTSWLSGKAVEVWCGFPLTEDSGLTGLLEPLPKARLPLLIPKGNFGLKDPMLSIGPGIGSSKELGGPWRGRNPRRPFGLHNLAWLSVLPW